MILAKDNVTDCIPYIRDLKLEIDTLKMLSRENNNPKISKDIFRKNKVLKKCIDNLKKLSNYNIEAKIYVYMLSGMSVSKAVNKVADDNAKKGIKPSDVSTIWKYYYPNLKKILNV